MSDLGPRDQRLAEVLRMIRIRGGLSTYRMAREVGVSVKTVIRIEQGKRDIRVRLLQAWCRAAGEPTAKVVRFLEHSQNGDQPQI